MPDIAPSLTDLGIKPEVAHALLPHLDSFAKWELIRFLHDNPLLAATIEDLARYTARDETELKPAARSLVAAGLLTQSYGGEGEVYSLTPDTEIRESIQHLVGGFVGDRLVRLAVSASILRAARRAKLQAVGGDS